MADVKQSEKNTQAFKYTVMSFRYILGWKTGPFFPVVSAHKIKVTTLSGYLLLLFLLGHIFASISFSHLNSLSLLSSYMFSLICATNLYTCFCSSD